MKKINSVLAAALFMVSSMATLQSAYADESWVCYAQGKESFGGPVGDIWQITSGSGDSELAAGDAALQNCLGQGLQSCMVTNCSQQQ